MKTFYALLSGILISYATIAQTTIWSTDFGDGCSQGQLANGFEGWTQSDLLNGNVANEWFVSATEAGMGSGNCGDGCLATGGTNRSLHLGNVLITYGGFPLAEADQGAAYNVGGLQGYGFTSHTDRRVESPVIDCSGFQNISISFEYMEGGQAAMDNAVLHVFNGSNWGVLDDLAKTTTCPSGQGNWTDYTYALSSSFDGMSNFQFGFKWVNNDDGLGSDPSFAVDNIVITGDITTGIQSSKDELKLIAEDGNLVVQLPGTSPEKVQIEVTDILGKSIASFNGVAHNGKVEMQLNQPAMGIILVNVVTGSERFTRKILNDQ